MESGPKKAPNYAHHRSGVTGADNVALLGRTQGINCSNYESAHIQVVPSGGADPDVEVYWWSESGGVWVPEHTPITRSGVGADTSYEFTVECRGRIMLVAVTAIAAGACDVYVSGFELIDAG
jgi:hypothetical protein